jgi:3'-phosphoadenosine 5'-phosphosulfate sulfotransferase (PAPS reductase)/FAD synthetase
MPTLKELRTLQALDLGTKNKKTDLRIKEWIEYWGVNNVAVSVSGGLDSTVLLYKVRKLYPSVRAVTIAAIECKENREVVKTFGNVIYLKPKYSQVEIIEKFGYPIGSKKIAKSLRRLQNPSEKNLKSRNLALTGITSSGRESKRFKLSKKWLKFIDSPFKISEQCCYYLKEKPQKDYAKENDIHYFVGTKAEDSMTRQSSYLGTGCNSFKKCGNSNPLGFWTHQDILKYTIENNLPVSKIYGDIIQLKDGTYDTTKAKRSGCFICGFGLHLQEQPNRFQRMEIDDPKMYDFAINKLGYGSLLDYCNIPYRTNQIPKKINFGEQLSLLDMTKNKKLNLVYKDHFDGKAKHHKFNTEAELQKFISHNKIKVIGWR